MWTTSGCLARRWPNHDSLNATRGTGLKLRVAARIEDANTSDDAAFNVAKDGEKAIAALNGAASAERRRILKSKRKRGGSAFAVAGSF